MTVRIGAFGVGIALVAAVVFGAARATSRNRQRLSVEPEWTTVAIAHLPSTDVPPKSAPAVSGGAVDAVLEQLSSEAGGFDRREGVPAHLHSTALSAEQLTTLIARCAPQTPAIVLQSIVAAESTGHPFRLATNGVAARSYDPVTNAQAAQILNDLIRHGVSVDIGLMQLNSVTLAQMHHEPDEALDACRNVAIGAEIFDRDYRSAMARHGPTAALWAASSLYNTGDAVRGVENGYASHILGGLRSHHSVGGVS